MKKIITQKTQKGIEESGMDLNNLSKHKRKFVLTYIYKN